MPVTKKMTKHFYDELVINQESQVCDPPSLRLRGFFLLLNFYSSFDFQVCPAFIFELGRGNFQTLLKKFNRQVHENEIDTTETLKSGIETSRVVDVHRTTIKKGKDGKGKSRKEKKQRNSADLGSKTSRPLRERNTKSENESELGDVKLTKIRKDEEKSGTREEGGGDEI